MKKALALLALVGGAALLASYFIDIIVYLEGNEDDREHQFFIN